MRVVHALERAAVLPGSGDAMAILSREHAISVLANVRRVPKHNLWIWYTATDTVLTLHTLTSVPP
jgi:hypothetical protein